MVWNFILWSVLNSPVLVGVLLTIVFSLRNLCFQYQVALKCLFFYLLKKKNSVRNPHFINFQSTNSEPYLEAFKKQSVGSEATGIKHLQSS